MRHLIFLTIISASLLPAWGTQKIESFPGERPLMDLLREDARGAATPQVLAEELRSSRFLDVPRMTQRQPFDEESVNMTREVIWLKETEDEVIFAFEGVEYEHGTLLAIFTATQRNTGPEEAPLWTIQDAVRRYGMGSSRVVEDSLRLVTSRNTEGEPVEFLTYSLTLGSSWTNRTITEIWRVTEKLMLEPVFSERTGFFDKSEREEVLRVRQIPRVEPGETVRDWKIILNRDLLLRGEEEEFENPPEDEELGADAGVDPREEAAEPEPIVEETVVEVNLLWDDLAHQFFVAEPKKPRLMDLDLD
jgi:hypothetical protein